MSSPEEIARAQAANEELWFDPVTAPEALLQRELRRLHRAIAGLDTPEPREGPAAPLAIVSLMHPRRPGLQERMVASVQEQTAPVRHLRIPMQAEEDMQAAHDRLAGEAIEEELPPCRYVLILDDDDRLMHPWVAEEVSRFAELHGEPAWIMIAAWLGPEDRPLDTAIWPKPWGQRWTPGKQPGGISILNMVVRRDIWLQQHQALARRPGDWQFAKALWSAGHRPQWLGGQIMATTQQIAGRGKPE